MMSLFSLFILGITGILLLLAFQEPTKRSIGLFNGGGRNKRGVRKESIKNPIDVEGLKKSLKDKIKKRKDNKEG